MNKMKSGKVSDVREFNYALSDEEMELEMKKPSNSRIYVVVENNKISTKTTTVTKQKDGWNHIFVRNVPHKDNQ